ncbi:hypothetical protein [Nonomuraea sp. NPDC046570]|uniref:hypothetical protein n=1 Tax=Nonomuraea sp. NPDC046570 TaxID=3155255 RepID=UPI0033E7EF5E
MLRRILVGAAIAGIAFIGSTVSASAATHPYPSGGPNNSGNNVLSQIDILNNSPILNGILNHSLNGNDIASIAHLEHVNLNLASNQNNGAGGNNGGSGSNNDGGDN